MSVATDPAYEFATLCTLIRRPSQKTGVDHLSEIFDVGPQSREFNEIIFSIIDRGWYLKSLIAQIDNAKHLAAQIETNLNGILKAFEAPYLAGIWSSHGSQFLGDQNVAPIFVFSGIVRPFISYPDLSEDERASVLAEVETLIDWLVDHQIGDLDFIRQALIDGLKQFQFRMERLNWLGWGYTLQSLKDVLGAYMALERGNDGDVENTTIDAMLQKARETIQRVYASVGVAKDVYERGDFILKAYGAASVVANVKAGGIVGLLTFS